MFHLHPITIYFLFLILYKIYRLVVKNLGYTETNFTRVFTSRTITVGFTLLWIRFRQRLGSKYQNVMRPGAFQCCYNKIYLWFKEIWGDMGYICTYVWFSVKHWYVVQQSQHISLLFVIGWVKEIYPWKSEFLHLYT